MALIENGDKLAIVKRGGKPRLALFALLKSFAPSYNPSDLFYRQGLREFLAACGVHAPPANAVYQSTVFAEGGPEGPRRIIFDTANISVHEKAAGAKSEGLTFGPCPIPYDDPVLPGAASQHASHHASPA